MFRQGFSLLYAACSISLLYAGTRVTGTVSGTNGEPLILSHVILTQPPDYKPLKIIQVGKNGDYRLGIDTPGIWMLKFVGVHHSEYYVSLHVVDQREITVDVQLGAYEYLNDFDNVRMYGNFNNWNVLTAIPFLKHADSTYSADIIPMKDSIVYQLLNVQIDKPFAGTQPDTYEYQEARGYCGIEKMKNNIARIVFNPLKLIRSDKHGGMKIYNTDSVTMKYSLIYDEYQRTKDQYYTSLRENMKKRRRSSEVPFEWSELLSSIENQLKTETDKYLLEELQMISLSVSAMKKELDKSLYKNALMAIAPSSDIWLLDPHTICFALTHSGLLDEQRQVFVREVLDTNPVARIKSILLFDEFHRAKFSGKKELAAEYYDILINKFGQTPETKQLKEKFPHEYDFIKGKPIPPFTLTVTNKSGSVINNESLKGKIYLIDFWAQWGEKSLQEMSAIHTICKKYEAKKFTVLSLSMDSTYQQYSALIKREGKYPWVNAYIGCRTDTGLAAIFQIVTIPKRFLIDAEGKLLAMGEELSVEKLEETLKNYIK